jgi:23S rRNA (guanosine2251-2'-O)-methyltransferase
MHVIYGIHPAMEALKGSGGEIERIFLAKGKRGGDIQKILKLATKREVRVEFKSKEYLDKITDSGSHQGIVCICKEYRYASVDDILANCEESQRDGLILILDCIVDPHNLGSLIRTGYCFGVNGVIIPEKRSASVTPAVIKVSVGAAQHIPIAKVVNISRTIDYLKEKGFWIYGTDVSRESDFYSFDYSGHIGLVMGSEEKGMRALVKKKCDYLISIPMMGKIDSLNVSVAGGIMLHEIIRRKFQI